MRSPFFSRHHQSSHHRHHKLNELRTLFCSFFQIKTHRVKQKLLSELICYYDFNCNYCHDSLVHSRIAFAVVTLSKNITFMTGNNNNTVTVMFSLYLLNFDSPVNRNIFHSQYYFLLWVGPFIKTLDAFNFSLFYHRHRQPLIFINCRCIHFVYSHRIASCQCSSIRFRFP